MNLVRKLDRTRVFPRGDSLPEDAWQRRHRGVQYLLAAHALALAAFGVAMGASLADACLEGGLVAALGLAASIRAIPRRARSVIASFGLMTCSAVLVHLSGGYIEAHFHFFVMLGVIFLYEDWLPYVLSVGYVAVHHGVMGTIDPHSVFNHPGAQADPWFWAGVHALFILGMSAALLVAWGLLARSRDGHLRAEAEANGLRAQLHAQEKLAALGTLVAGLAHEVRTPLTIVSTNAALIDMHARRAGDPNTNDEIRMHAREIHAGVDRMNALVGQLKRFHKLGNAPTTVTRLDPIVSDAVDLFLAANRDASNVRVDLRSSELANLHALGVQQIVLNLLANARDAVDPTEGRIVVRTLDDEAGPVLTVQDNGPGIPPDVRRRLFEPLFSSKKEGMGLGLSIVKRIVEDHRGRIVVDSEEGRGTVFRVQFPAAPAPAARAVLPTSVPVEGREVPQGLSPVRPGPGA